MSKPVKKTPRSQPLRRSKRLRLRDNFFRHQISPRQLLEAFDHVPGMRYFVKDSKSRTMAISAKRVEMLGLASEEDVIGLTEREYLPNDYVDHFLADDQWVFTNGKPLRNRVEMGTDESGFRDWIITDKYPLFNRQGKVVGLIGTTQFFENRRKMLGYLGPVGKATDFIRDRLGEGLMLSEIARHSGVSERQLQRLFRRAFGMTIQQFIIRSRIQAAIRELTHSQRAISEIALMFGFSDQSAFSNQFRAVTGQTPRVFRERYLARVTAGH